MSDKNSENEPKPQKSSFRKPRPIKILNGGRKQSFMVLEAGSYSEDGVLQRPIVTAEYEVLVKEQVIRKYHYSRKQGGRGSRTETQQLNNEIELPCLDNDEQDHLI